MKSVENNVASEFNIRNSTRRMDIAEFKSKGDWFVKNVFAMGGGMMVVNGNLIPNPDAGGFISGCPTGTPLMMCGLCGYTPLVNHFTLKNPETKELINVGSECVGQIINSKNADVLIKALESLKRKVDSDYKRGIYQKQLSEWLIANVVKLTELRSKELDERLKTQPDIFWSARYENFFQFDETGKAVMEYDEGTGKYVQVCRQVEVSEAIRRKDEKYHEGVYRCWWRMMTEKFPKSDWNPQNMAKQFKDIVKDYNGEIEVPKIRKLTDIENAEIRKAKQVLVDGYVKRLNHNRGLD